MSGQHIVVSPNGEIVAEYVTIIFDGQTVGELRDSHYYINESVDERTFTIVNLQINEEV